MATAERKKYKLLVGSHTTSANDPDNPDLRRMYMEGEELYLTKREAEFLGERVEPASGTASSNTGSDTEKEEAGEFSDLLSKSIPQIEADLKKVTDAQVLADIREEEMAGQNRKGVLDALKARESELRK